MAKVIVRGNRTLIGIAAGVFVLVLLGMLSRAIAAARGAGTTNP